MVSTASSSLRFYRTHGLITDPGTHAGLRATSDSPRILVQQIQGIVEHPFMPPGRMKLGRKRLGDLKLRRVSEMLARIEELDDRPLIVPRPSQKKLLGTCRDFATLFCAALREHRVPARVRYGFARYFGKGFLTDHVVCEYWEARENQWVTVDAQLDHGQRGYYGIDFKPTRVPRNQFLKAGRVWKGWRDGEIDPKMAGLDVSLNARGLSFIVSGLLRDLAGLNKLELLCTDSWGLGSKDQFSSREVTLLDHIADITIREHDDLQSLRWTFEGWTKVKAPSALLVS